MEHDYAPNFIRAIENPLKPLAETFLAEQACLLKLTSKKDTVLDAGCGAGRLARFLSPHVRQMVCIDNNKEMLLYNMQRYGGMLNITCTFGGPLRTGFPPATFDLTFSTYNWIGSIEKKDRQQLVNEMVRITKEGGKVLNITWKRDEKTTDLLKQYYPSIGIDIHSISEERTITSKGVFERLSYEEVKEYYEKAGLKDIQVIEVGPMWVGVIGTK